MVDERIDKTKPVPLHFQITNILREEIKSGRWEVGELFPTDKHLMERFGVSSTTVRRAVSELVNEGLLERRPGKGTFIKKDVISENLINLTGFFEEMRAKGHVPSSKVLSLESLDLTSELLEQYPGLSIFKDDSIFLVEKVQQMNGIPVTYLKSFWPVEVGREFKKFDLTSKGLYEIVSGELNIDLEKAEQTISAGRADKKIAEALEIPAGVPVLMMERSVYSNNRPLELSINHYRSDMYMYKITLHRNQSKGNGVIITDEK